VKECKPKRLSWVAYNVEKIERKKRFDAQALGSFLEVF
jgi:hypothetical protein